MHSIVSLGSVNKLHWVVPILGLGVIAPIAISIHVRV